MTETVVERALSVRELWREGENSIFVTGSGGIGINVHGRVIVRSLKGWHMLAVKELDDELARLP